MTNDERAFLEKIVHVDKIVGELDDTPGKATYAELRETLVELAREAAALLKN